jgi:hypothetical protein
MTQADFLQFLSEHGLTAVDGARTIEQLGRHRIAKMSPNLETKCYLNLRQKCHPILSPHASSAQAKIFNRFAANTVCGRLMGDLLVSSPFDSRLRLKVGS